jgi:hypothetical protein
MKLKFTWIKLYLIFVHVLQIKDLCRESRRISSSKNFFYCYGKLRLSQQLRLLTGPLPTNPSFPPTPLDEWIWNNREMRLKWKSKELWDRPVPVPICPLKIPHGLPCKQTWASVVKSWQWTMHAKWCMIPSGVVGACDNLNTYNIIYCESLHQLIIIWKQRSFIFLFLFTFLACWLVKVAISCIFWLTSLPLLVVRLCSSSIFILEVYYSLLKFYCSSFCHWIIDNNLYISAQISFYSIDESLHISIIHVPDVILFAELLKIMIITIFKFNTLFIIE